MTLIRSWRARALAGVIIVGAVGVLAWLPADLAATSAEAAVVPEATLLEASPTPLPRPSVASGRSDDVASMQAEHSTSNLGLPAAEATVDWSGLVIRMDNRSAALAAGSLQPPPPPAPPLSLAEPTSAPTTTVPTTTVVPATTAPAATVVPATTAPTATVVPATTAPTATVVPATTVPALTVVAVPTATVVAPLPTATVVPPTSSHASRGHAALARVGYDPGAVGYSISFHPGSSAFRGRTFTGPRHIEVYVRSSMSDADLAYVVAHEIGHAVDHIRNNGTDRERWRSAREMPASMPWWPDHAGSDLATPAGDFAECFASWAVGSPSHSVWGSCAGTGPLVSELAYG